MEHREDRKAPELSPEVVCREAVKNSMLAGVAAIDLDRRIVYVNPAFCRMTGRTAGELLGRTPPYPFCIPEGMEAADEAWEKILEEREESGVFEFTFRRRNDERFFVLVQVSALKDAEGRLKGWLGLLTDITRRKRAEEAILAERNLRRAIENSLLVGLAAVDLQGRYLHVNDAFCAMTGWSKKMFLGMSPPYGFWPPEKMEFFTADFARRLAARDVPGVMELTFLRRGGDRFNVLMHASPLRDARGTVQGCVASFHDITAWKEAEAALQESEERFRSLVEHSLVGVFIVREGRIVFRNPAQEALFGPLPQGFALDRLADGVHPEDLPRFAAFLMAALGEEERDRAHETEFRFAPRGPEAEERDPGDTASHGRAHRWVHCRTSPIVYRGKRAALVNMVDITRVKELERMALIQEKMVSLGYVATGIAHEIRNPLSGLNLYLAALEKSLKESETLEPEVRDTMQTILAMAHTASNRIDGVIRRVMDFASPVPSAMAPVCLNHCVEGTLQLSQVALRKAGIRLTKALAEDLPRVRGDARLLGQVLLNLITNAAQAMEGKEEKRIEVASTREGKYAVVTVADSGPGVPEGLREKIFDPFFTTKKEGTGIGLALIHRIVADHGGFITVGTSRLGGALFTVGLPAGNAGATAGVRGGGFGTGTGDAA
jgi:PAS domain S-box-containing protein